MKNVKKSEELTAIQSLVLLIGLPFLFYLLTLTLMFFSDRKEFKFGHLDRYRTWMIRAVQTEKEILHEQEK